MVDSMNGSSEASSVNWPTHYASYALTPSFIGISNLRTFSYIPHHNHPSRQPQILNNQTPLFQQPPLVIYLKAYLSSEWPTLDLLES
ncbi:hypothetical protein PGTUg99_010785 [Puccinia graminis f. sp. tritici]|uniref:Uncharacterized protein n=1 Tax=Puccinia graminis f. sp. tritici TaxID=56615 RepID=A0A5B0S6F6_PUCGR|nr:hypothetical protein PGTUg99_010785 [Puccinia graminis f. sp. tritici]